MIETRFSLIKRILRQVYGGEPSVDSNITYSLVNRWLGDGFCMAAKKNYLENGQIDGIECVNNSFYTTFSGLVPTLCPTEDFCYNLTLPDIPIGLGSNEGVSTLKFKDTNGNFSQDVAWLDMNQVTYFRTMRPVQNKMLGWYENNTVFVKTTLLLDNFIGIAKMVSAGDGTNLNSNINVPQEYFGDLVEYVKGQLLLERKVTKIPTNDGSDS